MISDPIGDMFTRIRNGFMASRETVLVPYSKGKEAVLKVLVNNQVVDSYEKLEKGLKKTLILKLSTHRVKPLEIKRVSKPGCRIYLTYKRLYSYKGGQGFLIISTARGVIDSEQAKKLKVGGEILAEVF